MYTSSLFCPFYADLNQPKGKERRRWRRVSSELVMAADDAEGMRAIGTTAVGHHVFMVFQLREINGQTKLRPISARYMHQKEIAHYERPS